MSGFVAFNVYLAVHTDSRLAWFRVENGGWEQNRPLQGLRYVFFAHSPQTASGWMRVATVIFVVIAVAAIVVTLWSSLPVWAKVMAVVTLIMAFAPNGGPASLRLQMAALPAFIAVGTRLRGSALACVIGLFGAGLVLLEVVYLYPSALFRGYSP